VMSLMGMTFMGAMPIGSLMYGKAAQMLGAPRAVMMGASVCMLGGLLFRLRLPHLRRLALPVYAERGIVPAVPLANLPRP
jgi:hypothetical protein